MDVPLLLLQLNFYYKSMNAKNKSNLKLTLYYEKYDTQKTHIPFGISIGEYVVFTDHGFRNNF